MRKLILFFAGAILVLALSPLFVGLGVKYYYYRLAPSLGIEIVSYERDWFSSRVSFKVPLANQKWAKLIRLAANEPSITVNQSIQHGPLIIGSSLALAKISNDIILPQSLTKEWGLKTNSYHLGEDKINFLGNYYLNWNLGRVFFYVDKRKVMLSEIKTALWISGGISVSGKVYLSGVTISSPKEHIELPLLTLTLDHRCQDNTWGNSDYTFQAAKMVYASSFEDEAPILLTDLKLKSNMDTTDGFLNSTKTLDIQKLEFNNQIVGPLHLKFAINNIATKPITDMLTTYESIMGGGELYRGQLKRQINAELPFLINPKSTIQLEAFQLMTPEGLIGMKGEVLWTPDDLNHKVDLTELMEAAHAKLVIQIPKPLLEEMILFFSKSRYFTEISPGDRMKALEAEDRLNFFLSESRYSFSHLIENDILDEDIGLQLFSMQQRFDPSEIYTRRLKTFLFEKQISLPMSYFLYWEYLKTQQPYQVLMSISDSTYRAAESSLRNQFSALLKHGFVKEDGEKNYDILLQWSGGQLNTSPSNTNSSP